MPENISQRSLGRLPILLGEVVNRENTNIDATWFQQDVDDIFT